MDKFGRELIYQSVAIEECNVYAYDLKELFGWMESYQRDREQVLFQGKFFEYCAIGYKANQYEHLEGLTAKEQYYKKADRR